ncbi:ABC transporter substrate-binding protein [Georgenia sp. AZ-5]|uniref:ABC transporter substrate-binding protein n=1 Tax=Georgenia sp. AZ-5 TaxID=3367526 RepID=UPI003754A94A
MLIDRRSRRLSLAVTVTLSALGVGLAACTPGVEEDNAETEATGGAQCQQPVRMLYATAEANAAAVQELLPQFREEFGVELEMETQPFESLQPKVFSEAASQSPYYDIFIVDVSYAPPLVDSLEPLSQYLTNPDLNEESAELGDFIPKVLYDTAVYDPEDTVAQYPDLTAEPAIDAITGEGFDVYGLPIQANAFVMAYRKDMFDDPQEQADFQARYGRELTVPQTWDEFTEVAEFFTRPGENLYGTTMMAGVGDWATDDFKTLLAAFGGNGRLIGEDFSIDFAGPEGEQALSYYVDLIAEKKVVPPGTTAASWDEAASTFDSGLTAMSFNYHSLALNPDVEGEIAYAIAPEGVDRGPHFGTWMLSINKNSEHKECAYSAIKWLTASEQQLAMTENQLHPTRTSVYDSLSQEGGEDNFYAALGESLEVGVGRPRLTNYTEISHAIAVGVNRAATEAATPRVALDEAAAEVSRLLEQAGYEVPTP